MDVRTPVPARPMRTAGYPCLRLLGPIGLVGAAGPSPARSVRQALEMLAWLLWHPASTAAEMAAGLSLAEGTRRATLSRLRSWLGADAAGRPYLPLAYAGRIRLHPLVTSDWQHVSALVGDDLARAPTDGLVRALRLVRGPFLQDAQPGRWQWADEVRADVNERVSAVEDELRLRLSAVRPGATPGPAACPADFVRARASPCESRLSLARGSAHMLLAASR